MNTFTDNYIILINDDNSMTVTNRRRIIQKSKLVDNLIFLVAPTYNNHNMADFVAVLEYVSPVSKKYKTEFLTKSDDMYNGYLKYSLPFDTNLTAEAGNIDLQLSFVCSELSENRSGIQRVRKITGAKISITPVSPWSDIIPDCALSALDQRIIKMDAQIKALNETAAMINDSKADNISYNEESNELQLLSGDKPIGDIITLNNDGVDEDGMPVVDFTNNITNPDYDGSQDGSDNSNNVIEF